MAPLGMLDIIPGVDHFERARMTHFHWPDDAPPAKDLGGKALSLCALRTSGLTVPPWFAVLPGALEASLTTENRLRLETETDHDTIASLLSNLRPTAELTEALKRALERLSPDGQSVAVRSSAREEDGRSASFAGQFESFLAVRPDDVPSKVLDVWRSAFAARVTAYRHQQGSPQLPPKVPAVIIQNLVRASASGVAFGADPVSGRCDRRVLAAVPGLGLDLVAGQTDADTWVFNDAGTLVSRHIAEKKDAWRVIDGRLHQTPLGPEESTSPSLTDAQAAQVIAAVETVGRVFGCPQDIEWAFEDGLLHVLQSRPITTVASLKREDHPLAIWDNSNIVESYSGVTTPLTFSFARRAYEGVYRQFCKILAVPSARIEAHDAVFANMLGLHRGRIYYNLLNWYRVLALLPGFTINRRFMEQMMGVKEPMPPDIVATLENAGTGARLKDAVSLLLSLASLALHHWRLPQTIRKFRARLEDALRPAVGSFESMDTGALAGAFLDLERRLLRRWDAPLLNDFLTMIFFGALRDITTRWSTDPSRPIHNDLLCGGGGMISAEPARRIAEMAHLAAEDPELSALLIHAALPVIDQALTQRPALRAALDAYLDRFGERCFDELKLESPTLLDDPLPLYRAIGRLASIAPHTAPTPVPTPRLDAEEHMKRALSGHPVRRLVFRWVLKHARAGVRERENLRLERTRLFGRVRRIFLALGRRFHDTGLLEHAHDVFLLEVDEILGIVSGAASSSRPRELVALRRAEFAAHRQADPLPNRFTTRGVPSLDLPTPASAHPSADVTATNEDERRGLGCCPGVVRGRVCVVTDPSRALIPAGAVLVAERTDPGWVLLFPGAAGLLVERGSLLSHSAIVARELRLPAVVSITGLMNWLRDGDEVEFDGATGVVRKLHGMESSTPSIPLPAECIGSHP